MAMKEYFVRNLKKLRKIEGLSQMKLAEKCGTDAGYIGQIEIGRRFPSIELIEKMAGVLAVEPYRLFMKDMDGKAAGDETLDLLSRLPHQARLELVKRLNDALCDCVKQTLTPS